MTKEELKAIPREYFRFVLKGKKVIVIFTDDGVIGGSFWDVEPCKK